MSDDISHIAKEVLKTGEVSKENISELAKLTAKQIYSQGYQAGEAANAIDVWNAAIEEAIREAKLWDRGCSPKNDIVPELEKLLK